MRKFFSLIAAVLFAGSMMATEVTFTKDDFAGQGTANTGSEVSATKDGVTFTFSKGYCADESLRCYAHGALSITAETTIEKINFTTTGGKTGGLDAEVTVGATSYSVDDLASQARFTQIVVTLEGGEPVVEDTYTVAGNDAAIFGEAWNPALAANDMTLNEGIYKWEKAGLNLTAGDIEFKVVKNHSWDVASYPAQNYVLNIAEDGEYTITITFDPTTEAVAAEAVKKVIPQYEVAEAIAAGLADNTEILVRGVITKMEFKGKNFAKYGSVNIYVADATNAEGEFEFYNCYSLNADTFRTSDPAYDAESTAWVEFEEVADENGNAIHVGDTVIAFGKYKLYSGTHELNTGCYLTEIKHPGDAPVVEHTYTVAGSPAAVFGEEWKPALEANDMQPIVGGEYTHSWQKENVTLDAGKVEFKVVEDHDWANPAYPAYEAGNYELTISEAAIYTISIFFNETSKAIYAEAQKVGDAPVEEDNVIYDWAGEIGTTILGASGVEVSTVKIHTNTETVPAIKFGSSYVYADGKWIAIKPAEGGFKAGDVLSVAAVFNNADDTKYAQVDLRAANGDTRIWMSDSASTINGRTSAAEPIVQTYTLEADQDSLFLGRYGNTGMFVTMLKVVREGGDVPPVEEHTYTVAGSSDVLFGTTWAPTNTANDMALVEGLYTWEKSEQTLAAGNILFKVCEDHAWTNCWPSDNYELNIPEAGIYTITITFNEETKEVAANATKTGDAVVIPSVAMHGNFLGSWADTENFAIAQDNASASLTLALAEGNYEFGMRIGGSGNWTANGANLTREANTTNLAEGSGNMHIAADVAGDYVFTYTYETQVLEVVYPEAPVVPDTIDVVATNVRWTDATASAGWWQITGVFGEYNFSISNISASQAPGIYTMAEDLDPEWTYLKKYNEDYEVVDSIGFVDGQVEVAISADNVVTVVGALVGNNGNVYMFNLSYTDPVVETTVNIEIPEWQVGDTYFASYGIFVLAGQAANGDYVQLDLITDGATIAGVYTEEDEDPYEVYGSGIIAGGAQQGIFSFTATIAEQAENGRALVTADILCYNNTLYHVTTLVGEGVDNIDAAVKAIKRIVNGQVVIEKAGKTYNMNGAVIR